MWVIVYKKWYSPLEIPGMLYYRLETGKWHCVPKTTKVVGERINLTFRNIA
jgi:hypothetical protein